MERAVRLHSRYNPQKEADRFVDAVHVTFQPCYIVITEPGESYVASSFRKKFPYAKLLAIRYTSSLFLNFDCLFDYVWRWGEGDLAFFLVRYIPDEFFSKTLFLSWKPSENIWQEESRIVWKEIKRASETILSVIRTRAFFGKTWAKNIFNNLFFSKHTSSLDLSCIEDSIFLTSGASLENFVKDKDVKESIENSFSICASSSISALQYARLKTSLSLSTDGGFWAGEHLKNVNGERLVIPLEAKVPKHILERSSISFITYNSAIEQYFFSHLNFKPIKAKRNGSISGTAIELLLENTTGNIFVLGLDLSFSKGFSHARPNENMQNNLMREYRLNPIENILSENSFNSTSLATYASWFASLPKDKKMRLFRLGKEGTKIEGIANISKYDFIKMLKAKKTSNFEKVIEVKDDERRDVLHSFFCEIEKRLKEDVFFQELCDSSKNSIAKEMVQLVAFSDYIALIKNEKGKNEVDEIKQKVSSFILEERKKMQYE